MNARHQILTAIRSSKPPLVALQSFAWKANESDLLGDFTTALNALYTEVVEIKQRQDVYSYLARQIEAGAFYDASLSTNGKLPFDLSLTLVEGRLGVAENGAIWVDTTAFAHEHAAALFSCKHLALLLKKEHLVSTLHEAYRHLPMTGFGYGVFIAGPSKTADIEQSLVIGAHGPKALTVFLY